MKTALLIIVLGSTLIGATVWALWVWGSVGDVTISGHGIFALILGVSFSLIIGCGLMFLVFYSHRQGYDDNQGDEF